MADIIYNDFDEEWISLDDKSFYDGDIHSQLARAYAYVLETATGTSAIGSVYLYNLTSTPHPTASDVVDNDQDMGRIVKFLAIIYSNLMGLLKSQPYTPYGETGSWYWGEPGTEASPTPLSMPDGFSSLASVVQVLAGLFDADLMPDCFGLREAWYETISTIRSMLEKMTFIYKGSGFHVAVQNYEFASPWMIDTGSGFTVDTKVWLDEGYFGFIGFRGFFAEGTTESMQIRNALRFTCNKYYNNPAPLNGHGFNKYRVIAIPPLSGWSGEEIEVTIGSLTETLTEASPTALFDTDAISALPSYVANGEMLYSPQSELYYYENYEVFPVTVTIT